MSAPPQGGSTNGQPANESTTNDAQPQNNEQKTKTEPGEDDEFEDFPVEDWAQEDTELPGGNQHLWEESWDDDDTSDDFAAQLREELKKVDANKK